jgi:hypothetical protein
MSFVVLSYVTDGDVPHDRAFVLWTQHSKVRHVVYYRLPLKPRR